MGYVISWALIYNSENINTFTPTFALWCVAVPLYDFFSVIIIRIFKKRSLIIANEDHIHHFLVELGFQKNSTYINTLCCIVVVTYCKNYRN